jgi:hypothetical protein
MKTQRLLKVAEEKSKEYSESKLYAHLTEEERESVKFVFRSGFYSGVLDAINHQQEEKGKQ